MCLGVLTLLKNTTPLYFAKAPLNLHTVQATTFLGNSPLYIGFS